MVSIKNSITYFLSNILTKAAAVIAIPIITRLMLPADYGILNVFITYVNIFSMFFVLSVPLSIHRFYFSDDLDNKELLGSSVAIMLSASTTFSVLIIIFYIMFNIQSEVWSLKMVLLMLIATMGNSFFQGLIQLRKAEGKSRKVLVLSSLQAYLYFGLSIYLLFFYTKTYIAPVASYSFVWSFIGCISFIVLVKNAEFGRINKNVFRILKYSIPLIPYSMSRILMAQFDRICISTFVGNHEAGLYSLAYAVGSLILLIIVALQDAWLPKYYDYMKDSKWKEHDDDNRIMFLVIVICLIGGMLFGDEFVYIFAGNDYWVVSDLVPLIVFSHIFLAVYFIYGRSFAYKEKNWYYAIIAVIASSFNLLSNIIFIPIYGYKIAAFTTMLTYAIMASVAYLCNLKIGGMHIYPLKKLIEPLLISSFLMCLIFLINFTLPIKIIIFLFLSMLLARKEVCMFLWEKYK